MARPKNATEAELLKVGVKLLHESQSTVELECAKCRETWRPDDRSPGGHLPAKYWHCPNGCNLAAEDED